MTQLAACDDCLRRTDLIAALAPWLDVEWRRAVGAARACSRCPTTAARARPDRPRPRTGTRAFSPARGTRADRGRAA